MDTDSNFVEKNTIKQRREFERFQTKTPVLLRWEKDSSFRFYEVENLTEKGFSSTTLLDEKIGSYVGLVLVASEGLQINVEARVVRRKEVYVTPPMYQIGFMVMKRKDFKGYQNLISSLSQTVPSQSRRSFSRRGDPLSYQGQEERRKKNRRGNFSIEQKIFNHNIGLDRWGSRYTYERVLQSACRSRVKTQERTKIMLGSNNYLGLSDHPYVKEATIRAIEKYGVGAGGVRVLSGTMDLHRELEEKIAHFKGHESCLLFSSGYVANLAAISTLVGKEDVIFCDERNHASIVDGCRMSGAIIRFYPHNNMESLRKKLSQYKEEKGKIIITDGVFSMDGDVAPLNQIVSIAKEFNAMTYVDDAHGTGVVGKGGKGSAALCGVHGKIDVTIATLSKALGSVGGAVCGSKSIVKYVTHHSRYFIFTSALPPGVCATVLASLEVIEREPEILEKLFQNRNKLITGLRTMGYNIPETVSAIIPIIIGDEDKTYELANLLDELNVFVNAVSRPAVPRELSRIRASVMATHSDADIEEALISFKNAGRMLGLI